MDIEKTINDQDLPNQQNEPETSQLHELEDEIVDEESSINLRAELQAITYRDANGQAYINFECEGEHHQEFLESKSALYLIMHINDQKGGGNLELKDAKEFLNGLKVFGKYRAPYKPMCKRLGLLPNDGIEILLSDTESIKVTKEQALKISAHENVFAKRSYIKSLPTPNLSLKKGEYLQAIDDYFALFGIHHKELQLLIFGLLLCYLNVRGPYPILIIKGPNGSGKSFFHKKLQVFFDNSTLDGASPPKSKRDLFVLTGQKHSVAIDNVSELTAELADAYCSIATGAQRFEREYFTNNGLSVVECQNPITMNGIPSLLDRDDFRERAIQIELPLREQRLTEWQLNKQLSVLEPKVMGALCHCLKSAITYQSEIIPDNNIRMVDAACFAEAGLRYLGFEQGAFLSAYKNNQMHCLYQALCESPLFRVIVEYLSKHKDKPIDDLASLALKKLVKFAKDEMPDVLNEATWPKQPQEFTRQLGRIEASLLKFNIRHTNKRTNKGARVSLQFIESPSTKAASGDDVTMISTSKEKQ